MNLKVGEVDAEQPGPDDVKTLAQIKFQTGDYMDVAIRTDHPGGFGVPGCMRRDRPQR